MSVVLKSSCPPTRMDFQAESITAYCQPPPAPLMYKSTSPGPGDWWKDATVSTKLNVLEGHGF